MQTGINYSSFTDKYSYNANAYVNKYITFNYVDSVIYSPSSGSVNQIISHPITVNDSSTTTLILNATKKYAMLNIPILIGYQWRITKLAFTFKTGIQFSYVISEKEVLQNNLSSNTILLETHSMPAIIRKTNWAGILSMEIGYNFYKHFGLAIEPTMSYYFNPQYKEMNINNGSPYTLGIKTGVFYNF